MRILFDCTYLRNRHTGVDVTFLDLIQSILKKDSKNQYTVIVDHRYNVNHLHKILYGYNNYEIKRIWCFYPLHIFISAFFMPIYIWLKKFDVYHNPYFFGPLYKVSKVRIVITVHDLYHKTIRDKMNSLHSKLLDIFGDWAVKVADKIIVISTQTKNDALTHYNITEEKLVLIYQAINTDAPINIDLNCELNGVPINHVKYILNVGKILPSKGCDELIKAYSILKHDVQFSDFQLVFAGISDTTYLEEMKSLSAKLGLNENEVVFLGYVNDNTLNQLYQCASLYVLPSYFEGFGLTALEAMKFKCPVIVRNASSLPEVAGNAALLFNNVDELYHNMQLLLTDKSLVQQLVNEGTEQLKKYSTKRRALDTLNTYFN
ncbi:glycosyltransferase family 4 protein [Mucilaginibacter terrae]|uniref:Glycosyltransferase involved in cell wall biosynthesis n=1 Tax=Mucilaginibacter terrae TaxID=1955052 RepID=A0ABU3GPR5_9SPHI|nr:glycosyltransferase family 1 protein [Mucilaginibacter terrae]MDT3401764.1 glycosyltransferase involved in cell wall biosynthesis [Mucilaginibacter terrae]